jgi:hypothetical protein
MKRFLILCLALGVGAQIGRMMEWVSKTPAVGGQGIGGAEKCTAQNGNSSSSRFLSRTYPGLPHSKSGMCCRSWNGNTRSSEPLLSLGSEPAVLHITTMWLIPSHRIAMTIMAKAKKPPETKEETAVEEAAR